MSPTHLVMDCSYLDIFTTLVQAGDFSQLLAIPCHLQMLVNLEKKKKIPLEKSWHLPMRLALILAE